MSDSNHIDRFPSKLDHVPRLGLGCMGMSEFYGDRDDARSLAVLAEAFELGYRHLDTADMYGKGHNEELVGAFLRGLGGRRHELLVATKAGIRRDVDGPGTLRIDSRPDYIMTACEASLRRLGVEHIDLYYLHRRDREIPIEDTIGAMVRLRDAGKIGAIGLCEVSAATLRRAAAEAPIAALQSEYSLWSRDPEREVFTACVEVGAAFVAYSPLGRGFLTGELEPATVAREGDLRGKLPRFQHGAFETNAALLEVVSAVAGELGATVAETSLAWVLGRGAWCHAIPGTCKPQHLADNLRSLALELSPAQRATLTEAFSADAVAGDRYPAPLLRTTEA
jgi:aryl-alcohol dehydrogenase-like predicted oxidoreductase